MNKTSLVDTLLNVLGLNTARVPLVETAGMPLRTPSRRWRSITYYPRNQLSLRTDPIGYFNERLLERNKYAPWGRGVLSGLSMESPSVVK